VIRSLLLLTLAVLLTGCVSGGAPPPRDSQPPRVRCLTDPHETGSRPLFFLFCIETP
jgi:PBP1b-binding outer membrane lipoprotein LpoB